MLKFFRWITNLQLIIFLFVAGLAFVPAVLFTPRQDLLELSNAVLIAAGLGIFTATIGPAWSDIRLPVKHLRAGQMLNLALCSAGFWIAIVFGQQYVWRALGRPEWLAVHWSIALTRWMLATNLILALISTMGSNDGALYFRSYSVSGLVVAGAVLVAAILITFGFG